MARYAGLEIVLRTEWGYIDAHGNLTSNIEEALVLNGALYGSRLDYKDVYKELGFANEEVLLCDVYAFAVKPDYEGRLYRIADIYMGMGCDYATATLRANYNRNVIYDMDAYDKFIAELTEEAYKYNEEKGSVSLNDHMALVEREEEEGRYDPETHRRRYFSYDRSKDSYKEAYEITMRVKNPHVEKYFTLTEEETEYYNQWPTAGLCNYIKEVLMASKARLGLTDDFQILDCSIENGELRLITNEFLYEDFFELHFMKKLYELREMHITRMFGSYVLLQRINGELKAVLSTEVPISYCPLMYKLLKEVGGENADLLLAALKNGDAEAQKEAMLNLINEVVIKGGYFDTSRPLNSCEANVLFGASETLSSAFQNGLIDAAVIVSNNLGTIITTNAFNTQGAVKRMTGLFYTTPSSEILRTALAEKIYPVFPKTAEIDQLAGVKKAIDLGYKNIAVTVASQDNQLLEEIAKLEKDGVRIYKFGLCSTGVSLETVNIMRDHADVIWTCASKYVKEVVEPLAIAQVGVKIPVHIMTEQGWQLVNNHLQVMNGTPFDATLKAGEEEPVVLNQDGGLKLVRKRDIHNCADCPHPCV